MELRSFRHKVDGHLFRLAIFGDAHVGVIHCEEGRLKRDVAKIADDPHCRVLLIGDAIDAINFSDKRFDPACIKPSYQLKDLSKLAQVQTDDFCCLVQPMAGKVDGFWVGNHETEALKRYHYDVADGFLEKLHLPEGVRLNTCALLRYTVEGQGGATASFVLYGEHGAGSSRTKEACLSRLKSKRRDFEADVYVCGHHHKRIFDTMPILSSVWQGKTGKLREKILGFGCTGSYLKTYLEGVTGYGEQRSYSPTDLGSLVLEWDLRSGMLEIRNL